MKKTALCLISTLLCACGSAQSDNPTTTVTAVAPSNDDQMVQGQGLPPATTRPAPTEEGPLVENTTPDNAPPVTSDNDATSSASNTESGDLVESSSNPAPTMSTSVGSCAPDIRGCPTSGSYSYGSSSGGNSLTVVQGGVAEIFLDIANSTIPRNFRLAEVSSNEATLTWDVVAGRSYSLEYHPVGVAGETKLNVPPESFGRYTVDGLEPGRSYWFYLRAGPDGAATLNVLTKKLSPTAAPTLSVRSISKDRIELRLGPGQNLDSNKGDGLRLYSRLAGGSIDFALVGEFPLEEQVAPLEALESYTTYEVCLTEYNAAGETPCHSETISQVTTYPQIPSAVESLSAVAEVSGQSKSVSVTFDYPTDFQTGTTIVTRRGSDGSTYYMPDQGETKQFLDTYNLNRGVTYTYNVALKNISGSSIATSVSVTVK